MRRRRTLGLASEAEARVREVERKIADREAESFVLFDLDGRQVYRRDGRGKYKVTVRADEKPLFRGRVMTHNHPPLTCVQYEAGKPVTYRTAGSLSPADVKFAAENDAAEVRVVAKTFHEGRVRDLVYSLERPAEGWPQGWKLGDFLSLYKAIEKVAAARLASDVRAGRATLCQVDLTAAHHAWEYVAPKIGARYTSSPLDGAKLGGGSMRERYATMFKCPRRKGPVVKHYESWRDVETGASTMKQKGCAVIDTWTITEPEVLQGRGRSRRRPRKRGRR